MRCSIDQPSNKRAWALDGAVVIDRSKYMNEVIEEVIEIDAGRRRVPAGCRSSSTRWPDSAAATTSRRRSPVHALLHGHCHHKAVFDFRDERELLAAMGVELETPDSTWQRSSRSRCASSSAPASKSSCVTGA